MLNLKKIKMQIIILYRNDLMSYEEIGNLYTIDFNDYSTKKLKSEYPIYDAAQFSHMPMKRTGKGSWESMESYTWIIRYMKIMNRIKREQNFAPFLLYENKSIISLSDKLLRSPLLDKSSFIKSFISLSLFS